MEDWHEIQQCKAEKRRELSIKDAPAKFEENGGVPHEDLYALDLLNFLEISGCGVTDLSENIKNLSALANLYLSGNQLQRLPDSVCTLSHLKVLDVSYNAISELPPDFGHLTSLQTLNLNSNKLSELPTSVESLTLLSSIDISNNDFTTVPLILLDGKHIHLAEFKASRNQIEDVGDGIGTLEALKMIDLSSNKIKELPQALASCFKLKNANYKDNPLKDRRLKKLIEQNNSSQKAIMDYIRTKGRPPSSKDGNTGGGASGGKGGKKKKKGGNVKDEVDEDLIKHIIEILKFGNFSTEENENKPLEVIVSDEVKDVRPYIVCCIVKRLDLSRDTVFKKFLAIQTKLHDEACGKRTIGTIASHDVPSLLNSTINYDAKEPDTFKVHLQLFKDLFGSFSPNGQFIQIQPLGRTKGVTALKLYKQLRAEAAEMKREKKRSQVTGIYKYLSLLESQEKFAYLSRSCDDAVISLPPLTNSELSKIKMGQNDVLLEVTSSQSLSSCKTIMDKLLQTMVNERMTSAKEKDFYSDSSDEEGTTEDRWPTKLIVQQVRVLDSNGKMKVVYPSRTDLDYAESAIKIQRPH